MDERPSVPRWVGEGEAGNRSLSPTEAWSCGLAGWREAWDARTCGGLFGFPEDPSWEPFANIRPAHLRGVPGPGCVTRMSLSCVSVGP